MRYYFRNHDELLIFAAQHVLEQSTERIRRRLADQELTGKERVGAVLAEILPLDAKRATEITVFVRLAEIDDEAGRGAQLRRSAYEGCRSLAEFAVTELARTAGADLPAELKDQIIERFHLTLDGLAYQCVLNPGLLAFEDVAARLAGLLDHLEEETNRGASQAGGSVDVPTSWWP
nr:TetR family transcriptional regulator C-terminal domain-containing protein [Phytoactinopolyspora mesophila]